MAHAMPPGMAPGVHNAVEFREALLEQIGMAAYLGARNDGGRGHRLAELTLLAVSLGITQADIDQAIQDFIAAAAAAASAATMQPPAFQYTGNGGTAEQRLAASTNDQSFVKRKLFKGEAVMKMIFLDQPTDVKTLPVPDQSHSNPLMNNARAALATGGSSIYDAILLSTNFTCGKDAMGALMHNCPAYHATMPAFNMTVDGNNHVTATTILIIKQLLRECYGNGPINHNDRLTTLGNPTTWHTNTADVVQFWTLGQNLATFPPQNLRNSDFYASANLGWERVPPVGVIRNRMHTDRFEHQLVDGFALTSTIPAEQYLQQHQGVHAIMPGNMLSWQTICKKPQLFDKNINPPRASGTGISPKVWQNTRQSHPVAQAVAGLRNRIIGITNARAAGYQHSDLIEESQHAYVNMDLFNAMHGQLAKQDREYYTNRSARDFNTGFVVHQVDAAVARNAGARTAEWMHMPAHYGLARLIMPAETKMAFQHINGPWQNPFTQGKMLKYWDYCRPLRYPELWWLEFLASDDSSSESDSS